MHSRIRKPFTKVSSSELSSKSPFEPRSFPVPTPEQITPEGEQNLQAEPENHQQLGNSVPHFSIFRPDSPTPLPPVQMKLTIGKPGDKYEQEADRIARDVIQRINAPQVLEVQRRESSADEDKIRMQPLSNTIQRLSVGDGMTATPDLETTIQNSRGSGQPLAETIRQPMEQAFGADFSGVKIHNDNQADKLNQSIQAKAFTTGQDIFFRQGAYEPGSRGGQELIAHELTHVVQQNSDRIQRVLDTEKSQPIKVSATAPTDVIQMKPLDEQSATQLIREHCKSFADEHIKKVTKATKKIWTPISQNLLLAASLKSVANTMKNAITQAQTIATSKIDFGGANLRAWGDPEKWAEQEKQNNKEALINNFVGKGNWEQMVAQMKKDAKTFLDEITVLQGILEKIPQLYTDVQQELVPESQGETLSPKLNNKLETFKKQTELGGMQASVKEKLDEVMGEINPLTAAKLDVDQIMTTIKGKATTKVFKDESGAKEAIRDLIAQEESVKTFRSNQEQIKQKAQFMLTFFANADTQDDVTLAAGIANLPVDNKEIHNYYLKKPDNIGKAITPSLWVDYQDVTLNLWLHYKENWLDAVYALSTVSQKPILEKLKKTTPFNWQNNLLKEAQPPSEAKVIAESLKTLASPVKKDFLARYEIERIGSNMGYREVYPVKTNNVLTASKNPPGDRIGYVINITTIPSDPSPQEIAEKYYAQGFDDPSQAKERIALVVGVNKFRSLNDTSDQAVKNHAAKNSFDKFSLAAFGFTWDFNWKKKAGSPVATDKDGFDGAFKAFKEQDDTTQQKALQHERDNIKIQDRLPYAQFKERVTAHPQTHAMVQLLNSYNKYVYIHLGDSDAVSLKAPGEQPTQSTGEALKGTLKDKSDKKPEGIFSRYDVVLENENHPFMAIGGYEFRTKGTTGEETSKKGKGDLDPSNLEHLLTYLANQLDQAVRIAVASVNAKAVYPTEPNLVFMAASPDYDMYDPSLGLFTSTGEIAEEGALYGEGAREGRKLQNNLLEARETSGIKDSKIVYDPRLGIATDSDRFRLEGGAIADYKPTLNPHTSLPNPTYEQRRKNAIVGKTNKVVRKEIFKSQVIEDITKQPQTFVERSLNLEINEIFSTKLKDHDRIKKFTHRISNVISQKYIKKDKFKAAKIENLSPTETDERIKILDQIIQAVETTLKDSKLDWLWAKMNETIDALYTQGYTKD